MPTTKNCEATNRQTKTWRYRNNGAADFLFQRHLFGCQTQRLDGDGRTSAKQHWM